MPDVLPATERVLHWPYAERRRGGIVSEAIFLSSVVLMGVAVSWWSAGRSSADAGEASRSDDEGFDSDD